MTDSQNDDPYSLPHGSEENTRLDAQHQAIMSLLGNRTFHAPVTSPSKILDIGCGSGIATLELAKRFPSAQVIGVDLAPVIGLPSLPPNLSFVQGTFADLVGSSVLVDDSFDYIFQRMLVMGVVDWQAHTKTVLKLLKPGGWAEMQDLSWHVYDQNEELLDKGYPYIKAIQSASLAKGLDPFCGEHLGDYMRAGGLLHVSFQELPFAWAYWSERPETELIAAHQQSERQVKVRNALLDKLLGNSGLYSQQEIEDFKQENATAYEQAQEGVHSVYGVAFGKKPTTD